MQLKQTSVFFLSRMSFHENLFAPIDSDQQVPAWTTFNTTVYADNVPRPDIVGYLQVIDSSPSELSTVYTVLHRSLAIADKLHQNDAVIVFDQAIYAKALEIIWQKPDEFKRVVCKWVL